MWSIWRKSLLKEFSKTSNHDILNEVYRLLEIEFNEQEKYKLLKEQKSIIIESKEQIARGEFLTNEQSNEATEKWLKGK